MKKLHKHEIKKFNLFFFTLIQNVVYHKDTDREAATKTRNTILKLRLNIHHKYKCRIPTCNPQTNLQTNTAFIIQIKKKTKLFNIRKKKKTTFFAAGKAKRTTRNKITQNPCGKKTVISEVDSDASVVVRIGNRKGRE